METLPHALLLTTGLQLRAYDIDEAPAQVTLMVTAIRRTSRCPHGHVRTRRLHSRYERRLADVPWAGYQVRGHLRVRQLFCANAACRQRVFTERLPDVARPYARRTLRLIARLGVSGLALGGAAGARLTQRLGLHASRDTLLRLVRRLPLPNIPPLSAIGVDDWAHRQRQRYGTIVVDLEPRRPVALLHDREAATLTSWLREPAGMTVMARDRMKASSDAARAGAPQARQVADRFPLLQNLAEALAHVFSTHGKALQAVREALRRTPIVQPNGQTAVPVPPSAPAPQAQAQAAPRRSRRLATDERVWARSRQGWSKRAIAQQLGIGRRTVGRFLQAPTCPERKGRSDTGKSLLSPYKAHFLKPWNAGGREALQLFRDLRRRGYTGSSPTVARDAPRLRHAQG